MAEFQIAGYGPSTTHLEYGRWSPIWRKCRDVLAGEEAIKDAGSTYLPKMEAMNETDYDNYKTRALFYGASYRTLQGLMGSLLRKEPLLHVSLWHKFPAPAQDAHRAKQEDKLREELASILSNVTQTGVDLQAFTRDLVSETLGVGRVGLLVDMPPAHGDVSPKPYFRLYRAESILNWRERYIGGVPVLDQVVLMETVEMPSGTGFGSDWLTQYRELVLDENGNYIQNVYTVTPPEKDEDEALIQVIETHMPTHRGRPLKHIPFHFMSPTHMRPEIDRPPLLDLYNVNVSHYRSSADLEHGRHFTALPTPIVAGIEDEDENGKAVSLRIGSGTAWLLPSGATARMLEFNGQGLKHLENALKDKEAQMVNLGARMLEQDKRTSETAEALRLRQAGDIASLNVLADVVGSALTKAVRLLAWWADLIDAGDTDTLLITLNKDFFESRLAPGQMSALVSAWQSGAIGFKDLYDNLVRGEIIDSQRDYDDVKKEVEIENGERLKRALAEASAKSSGADHETAPAGSGNKEKPGLVNDNGNRPLLSKAE